MKAEKHPERRIAIILAFLFMLLAAKLFSSCCCSSNVYEIIGTSENHVYVSRVGSFNTFQSWYYPQADTLEVGKFLIQIKE